MTPGARKNTERTRHEFNFSVIQFSFIDLAPNHNSSCLQVLYVKR